MKRNTIVLIGAVGLVALFFLMVFNDEINTQKNPSSENQKCSGNARCISGFVTRIVDGDTITVDGQSIRFALVNTPEFGEKNYTQAKNYIENICPIGSRVLVDEDDRQTEGSYGRIIGVIYCNGLNLGEEILEVGYADILYSLCTKSEFVDEPWAQKFGC